MDAILDHRTGAVARLTLNRPERRNAINAEMLVQLEAALRNAQQDPGVRLIVLQSAGKVFSAGDDLDELPAVASDPTAVKATVEKLQDITRHIMLGRCPVICVVRGWAIGAGASWPLNADLTLWSETARICFPEARHGLFPSGGSTWLLTTRIGDQHALRLLLSGEVLEAARLSALGLGEAPIADAALETAMEARIGAMLALPPPSLEAFKRAQAAHRMSALETALKIEADEMCASVARLTAAGAFPRIGEA